MLNQNSWDLGISEMKQFYWPGSVNQSWDKFPQLLPTIVGKVGIMLTGPRARTIFIKFEEDKLKLFALNLRWL
jgi:hypothetical protein